jgi:hypothetical protein
MQAPAQGTRVAVGFGVDTSAVPNHEIFSLWRAYLASGPESLRASPHWSSLEQAQWPDFDLLRGYVYKGFPNLTVVQLAPAPGLDSTYVIRTLVSKIDDSQGVKPLALYRVYATREGERWVLGNALPRLTRAWKRETFGPVTFVYPPARAFHQVRARASAGFADSLAQALHQAKPSGITYFIADDMDEIFGAMGLDYFPLGPDTTGGRSNVRNKLVFVGSSSAGESNRHELAHVVLGDLVGPRTAHLVSEGLATWTGGSAGLAYRELLPGLRRYVEEHLDIGLESIMTDPPMRQGTLDVGYDGFAVVCEMVYERRGLRGIRELAQGGRTPDLLLPTVARLLGVPRAELDALWRRRILASAK